MRFARVLQDALRDVVVAPIQDGMPQPRRWPGGVAPILALAGVAYLISMVLVLAAPWIMRHDALIVIEGREVISAGSMTVITWLVTLTLGIGLTAVLHIQPVLRIIAVLLLLAPLTPIAAVPERGWMAALGGLVIIVIFLVRARGRFALWEFPVLWGLVCVALLGPLQQEANFGYDQRTLSMQLVLLMMTTLALPALLMGGYAASQIGVSLAQRLGFGSAQALPQRLVVAVIGALVVLNLADAVVQTIRRTPGWSGMVWLGSGVALVLVVAVLLALRRALPEVPSQDDPAEPDELINAWHEDAYLLAMLMLAPMLLAGVSSVSGAMVAFLTGSTPDWLATVSTNNASVAIGRLLQAGFAGVLAWRRARSGDRVAPMVLGAYATIMTLSAAAVGTGWRWLTWEPEPVGVLLLVGLLVALVTRGNRPAGLQHGLVLVLLVSLYRFREVLSEPGTVFATASATGVLLISLLWRVLTDGELARGDSRQFPHASRILVYATMSLLAVVSLAISAQVRVEGSALDQTSMMAYGDRTLGGALFFAAGLAALAGLRRTTGHPAEEPLVQTSASTTSSNWPPFS